MIEQTKFNNEEIKKILKQKYNLNIKSIQKINRGSANIFKIETKDEKYILKEFQSKYNQKEIEKEVHVINHLKIKNLQVPEHLKNVDGTYMFDHQGNTCILEKYIEGDTIGKNTGNKEMLKESAKYLALIIKGLEDYPYDDLWNCNLDKYSDKETFSQSIQKYNQLIELSKGDKYEDIITKDLTDKIEMIKTILIKDLTQIKNVTVKATHGDYNVLQFIYEKEHIKAIIDFASAAKLPVVWEIIRSYSYLDKEAKNGKINIDNLVFYTKEYLKYEILNEYDLKYMPYIYLTQLLNSTYGYKQYLQNQNEELLKFRIERTNYCQTLFKDSDEISQKLLKLTL